MRVALFLPSLEAAAHWTGIQTKCTAACPSVGVGVGKGRIGV